MTAVPGKKPEGWLGFSITAVLCLGFLYWWFRPNETNVWPHQTPAELTARALREPPPETEAERLLRDFDLLELTILQAKLGMAPEGLEAAKHIAHPVIQARAVRQAAQAFLNSDSERLDQALAMCDMIVDPALRVSMRDEILLQIAMLGFADVVLPQAKGPVLRARLARVLMETDSQAAGRTLLEELESKVETLPANEAATVRRDLAWARVWLALEAGPAQAFPAIRALPAAEQRGLWLDLLQVCFGRGDSAKSDAAAVAAEAAAALPEIRHDLELEALQANLPLRPVVELMAELQAKAEVALDGEPKIRALLALASARQRAGETEAAAAPLRQAQSLAAALPDLKQRAIRLGETAGAFSDSLLMTEAAEALQAAAEAARALPEKAQRLPALVRVMEQAFNNGQQQTAAALADEAVKLTADGTVLDSETLKPLANFLIRTGDWSAALGMMRSIPDPAAKTAALAEAANTAAEECMVYDAGQPPPRGQPLDQIRDLAGRDETAAAALAKAQPAGFSRARAWLAMAKGQLLPATAAPGSALTELINNDPSTPLPDDVLPPDMENTDDPLIQKNSPDESPAPPESPASAQ